ncbi:Hypothetical protein POVR1_LOCUS133 [uncultured virus]|nr:Hypothetical protein POVR1_LOCUS133 [uncultured virus]
MQAKSVIVINAINALPFRDGLWIVKVSEDEWRNNGLDEQKRVKVKMPEWWLFVASTKTIPKESIRCKVIKNTTEFGEIHNYSYLGPVKEQEETSISTTMGNDDDIRNKIVSLSVQIFDLEQQRIDLIRQLKGGQPSITPKDF